MNNELTVREHQVIEWLNQGHSTKEVAYKFNVSPSRIRQIHKKASAKLVAQRVALEANQSITEPPKGDQPAEWKDPINKLAEHVRAIRSELAQLGRQVESIEDRFKQAEEEVAAEDSLQNEHVKLLRNQRVKELRAAADGLNLLLSDNTVRPHLVQAQFQLMMQINRDISLLDWVTGEL